LEQLRSLRSAQATAVPAQGDAGTGADAADVDGSGGASVAAAAAAVAEPSPGFAAEEQALKLSLSAIVAQLQAIREAGKARRSALLLAVQLQVVPFLPAIDVLRVAGASPASRITAAADSGLSNSRALFVPNLDAAPLCPQALQRFLSEVSLGSVRSLALPCEATALLLKEHRAELTALEQVVLPGGFREFGALLHLPALRHLAVDASIDTFDVGAADRLAVVLRGLRSPLQVLRLEALSTDLASRILGAATSEHGGRIQRIVLRRCILPDEAVARVCEALSACALAGAKAHLAAVHFEECELSDLAEQRLLAALEQDDGSCVVTIEGGTTRASEPGDVARWPTIVRGASGEGTDGRSAAQFTGIGELVKGTGAATKPLAEPLAEDHDLKEEGSDGEEVDKDTEIARLKVAVAERDAKIQELEARLAVAEDQTLVGTRAVEAPGASTALQPAADPASECPNPTAPAPPRRTASRSAALGGPVGRPGAVQRPAAAARMQAQHSVGHALHAEAVLARSLQNVPVADLLAVALIQLQEEFGLSPMAAAVAAAADAAASAACPAALAESGGPDLESAAPPATRGLESALTSSAPAARTEVEPVSTRTVLRSRFGFALEGREDEPPQ